MKKFDTKIQNRYDKLFAEARASRWMGFYQYAEKLLLRCYKYYKRTKQKNQLSDILKELADFHMESEKFSKALVYLKELLDLFKQFGTKINIANTLNDLGRIYQNIGELNLATENFEKSLKISKKVDYKLGVSIALTNLATQLRFEGKIENALDYLIKAKEICEDEGYYENLMVILIAIGSIYSDMGKLDKTEEYLGKAENNISLISKARLVASFYGELGTFYQWVGNLDKSVEFLNKGLQISRTRRLKITSAQILLNLGIVMSQKEEFNESYNYLTEALSIFKEIKNKILISRVLTSMGLLFKKQNNYPKAITFLEDSQNIAKNENDIMVKIRNYGLLGECYKETKKYYESYRNFTQCILNYQQLLNNIYTISLRESFKERFEDLITVVHELNNLLESGIIDLDVSEIIETREITINTCKKSKKIYPNLPKEDLIKEIEKFSSITDDLKGGRLEIIIEKFQPNLKINLSQNPDLDAKEHADCILTCTKKENTRSFYIWLYLVWKGDWSLINLINRLEQERGVIPNGTHLLVPLNIEENHNFEEIHKWWLYSDTYIKKNLDYCVKSFLKNEFPKMTRLQLITMNKRELKNKLKTFTKFYKP